ncbi:MAG: hypothetical protein ABI131_08660 [Nostocoides sp.]
MITPTVARHLTPEQFVEREHLHRSRSAARSVARATRARLAADLVRIERWAHGGELWTSSSDRVAH